MISANMIGLALSYPICVGFLLVLGTTFTYIIAPEGNPYWVSAVLPTYACASDHSYAQLFAGVGCSLVAVSVGSWASWEKNRYQEQHRSATSPGGQAPVSEMKLEQAESSNGSADLDEGEGQTDSKEQLNGSPTAGNKVRILHI